MLVMITGVFRVAEIYLNVMPKHHRYHAGICSCMYIAREYVLSN